MKAVGAGASQPTALMERVGPPRPQRPTVFRRGPIRTDTMPSMTATSPAPITGLLLHGHDEVPDSLRVVAEKWQTHHDVVLRLPSAPFPSNGGGPGRAWWPADEEGPDAQTLADLLDLLLPAESHFQNRLQATADHPGVLIAGFSQGGAMAAALAAAVVTASAAAVATNVVGERLLRRVRLVVVAGFLPEPLDVAMAPADSDLRVLVISGEQDTVVDPFHGALLARRFRRRGWTVDEHSHPGGHQWNGAVTDLAAAWLTDHTAPGRSEN